MKKTERVLIVMIVLGQTMRILNINGGILISLFGTIALCMLYLFLGSSLFTNIKLKDLFKKEELHSNSKHIAFSVLVGIGLAFCVSGIVLKLQIIQDANVFLAIGLSMLLALFYILVKYWRQKLFFSKVATRIISFGLATTLLLVTPSLWLVDVFYFRDPDYAKEIKEKIRNPEGATHKDERDKEL